MQQAIDILDRLEDKVRTQQAMTYYTEGVQNWAIHYLREARKEIQDLWDGWISVNDRLPEEISNSRILTSEDWVTRVAIYDRWWIREDNENLCYFDFWMPLPNSPKQ